MSLARAALVALLLFSAAPARAAEVAHVHYGSRIAVLVTAPDGGAWVLVERGGGANAIGRASADDRFRTTAVDEALDGAAIGPDGQAWFGGLERTIFRAGVDGAVTRGATLPARGPILDNMFASAPDGRLWATTVKATTFAQVTAQGAVTLTTEALPACDRDPKFVAFERAADGALWLADIGCNRFLRRSPAGAWTQISLGDDEPEALAADASGGMWFTAGDVVGHVDSMATVTTLVVPPELDNAIDVAVAADGSAWFATGRCRLLRAAPAGGQLEQIGAPVPANLLAFGPDGRLWAASRTRLVHVVPSALHASKCDDRSPALHYRDGPQMTLERLRRGLRIAVREPARITVFALYGNHSHAFTSDIRSARGGARRFRPSARWLRRIARELAAGRKPLLDITYTATDEDGNTTDSLPRAYRVTR